MCWAMKNQPLFKNGYYHDILITILYCQTNKQTKRQTDVLPSSGLGIKYTNKPTKLINLQWWFVQTNISNIIVHDAHNHHGTWEVDCHQVWRSGLRVRVSRSFSLELELDWNLKSPPIETKLQYNLKNDFRKHGGGVGQLQ